MSLPFSEAAFLDVFGAYNRQMWPAVAALWLLTAFVVWRWWRRGVSSRVVFALLATHWAWSGIAYHWFFFRNINSAAPIFAALFVLQAGLLSWLAVRSRGSIQMQRSLRGALAGALALYAMAYPILGLSLGLDYPRIPVFAVPCPTMLLTAGFLLNATGTPRFAEIVPVIWAGIGSSAALLLGIRADLALIPAGAILLLDAAFPAVLGEDRLLSGR